MSCSPGSDCRPLGAALRISKRFSDFKSSMTDRTAAPLVLCTGAFPSPAHGQCVSCPPHPRHISPGMMTQVTGCLKFGLHTHCSPSEPKMNALCSSIKLYWIGVHSLLHTEPSLFTFMCADSSGGIGQSPCSACCVGCRLRGCIRKLSGYADVARKWERQLRLQLIDCCCLQSKHAIVLTLSETLALQASILPLSLSA